MAEASDTFALIYQNLRDAGCDMQMTEDCMSLVKGGDLKGILPILQQYRKVLLMTVRSGQKKIDCLDFLVYQIKHGNII